MLKPAKLVNLLFDESHSESWSTSRDYANKINPKDPDNSGYSKAASALDTREFNIARNDKHPLTATILKDVDLLVLLHPTDDKWERTTVHKSPKLTAREINTIHSFIKDGGALLVITEYENDKYGNNLNELLSVTGIQIQNSTVSDRSENLNGTPTWVLANMAGDDTTDPSLRHGVNAACFYRAASCRIDGPARPGIRAGLTASPPSAVLIALSELGKGRIAVVGDSDLFGDQFFEELDHAQLWLNLIYWLSLRAFDTSSRVTSSEVRKWSPDADKLWNDIKERINSLRVGQSPGGSLDLGSMGLREADEHIDDLLCLLPELGSYFPHQSQYIEALSADLQSWRNGSYQRPDFARSLSQFSPQDHRNDHSRDFVLFPMYTPNASLDVRFESLLVEIVWPDWLASIYKREYAENDKFLSAKLIDHTDGYASECAVLFPETVSINGGDRNQFGMIFCDRESARFCSLTLRAAEITRLHLHPELSALLRSPQLALNAFALWDLIHDTSHSRGELPFDPFMIRQKAPYWMYALEELRVDLRSFLEASELAKDFPTADYVQLAVLFDRIFRFAVSGSRIRNYDGLAGQLLFTALHAKNILIWNDNKLSVAWEHLRCGVQELYDELISVYRRGQVVSKVQYWSDAHDFLSKYMAPNVASNWSKDKRVFHDESRPRDLVRLVHDDEFPLGSFHLILRRKLGLESS